jgi:hypothetical protein
MKTNKLDPGVFVKSAIKVFNKNECMCLALDEVLDITYDNEYHCYISKYFKPEGINYAYWGEYYFDDNWFAWKRLSEKEAKERRVLILLLCAEMIENP